MMQKSYSIGLLLVLITPYLIFAEEENTREGKLISTFQIVRFPNDPCVGSNSRNGTCYTSQECSDKSGTSSGSCADGFGVCCTFIIDTCDSTTSENLTAWKNPTTVSSGMCGLTVCPIDDSICSIRLDFTTFVITGPSTISAPHIRRAMGHPANNLADAYNTGGSSNTGGCLTDTFYMKSASASTNAPSLCGTASGEHMYLEADVNNCNYLQFYFADAATSSTGHTRGITTLATRSWDMTITQIECSSKVLPPTGCTKYFWNAAGRAELKSSNYQVTTTSIHLAQQHDRYCVRRERGFCVGCFAVADSGFKISGRHPTTDKHYTIPAGCCGYSSMALYADIDTAANSLADGSATAGAQADSIADGLSQFGWDCIVIPGAYGMTGANAAVIAAPTAANLVQVFANSPAANVQPNGLGPQICGNSKGIGFGVGDIDTNQGYDDANAKIMLVGSATNISVCTRTTPFILEFMSDDLEGLGGNTGAANAGNSENTDLATTNLGFSITLNQLAC